MVPNTSDIIQKGDHSRTIQPKIGPNLLCIVKRLDFSNFIVHFVYFQLGPSCMEVAAIRHNFGMGPPQDNPTKLWSNLANQIQKKIFLKFHPFFMFSMTAILVRSSLNGTKFWKRSTLGPLHQSPNKLCSCKGEDFFYNDEQTADKEHK